MAWDVDFDTAEFRRALRAEAAAIETKTNGALLDRMGSEMAQGAAESAPERTGELARGIGWRRTGRDEVEIYSSSDHSFYVEYGTSDTRAQPFMRPTWAEAPAMFTRQVRAVF